MMKKADPKPIPPRRGIFPEWIFRSLISSYHFLWWEIRITNDTAQTEKTTEIIKTISKTATQYLVKLVQNCIIVL
jgi:hypothetical protein